MTKLFSSLSLRSLNFKNRIVVSPMCQYSSVDGFANDWHLVHLGSRAVGGAALVFTEATAICPEGRISPQDLGIWKDEHVPELKRIVDFIHAQGSVAGIQLAHAGRKASKTAPWEGDKLVSREDGGWQTVAPSAIPFSADSDHPIALDIEGINKVIDDFKAATQRAIAAGFKVIEIHAAHGYLIHEFLSPLANKRTDEYGGSFENRTRFLIEITRAIREIWPSDLPLFVRISASDWTENGWTIEDSIKLGAKLKTNGVDLIDCSSGGILPDIPIPAQPNYQVPFAAAVREKAGIPTGAVGIIVSSGQAESILQNGEADLIIMARELLRDPYFPLRAATELDVDLPYPLQYERAKRKKK
ncbi:MAG TPA: NADPH dehydrogenase NamA [Flavipsychrobacter sp.]|nr:NADPH dehydrogenase NamA [Flavipsychrobacter sp.]